MVSGIMVRVKGKNSQPIVVSIANAPRGGFGVRSTLLTIGWVFDRRKLVKKLRVTSCGFNQIKVVGDREQGVGKNNKNQGARIKD